MREYKYSSNYDHPLLAELYDRIENYTYDIELIKSLLGNTSDLNILECFSGTGRILIPLAKNGHRVTGIDIAKAMNKRAAEKLKKLNQKIQERVFLKEQDIMDGHWGNSYDIIIVACNAFFELPSVDMQERVIEFAYDSLKKGGRIYIDNDDYKGNWSMTEIGNRRIIFEGNGHDGSFGRFTMEGLMFDISTNVLHMKRTCFLRNMDGSESYTEYLASKRPISAAEVEGWLKKHSFNILAKLGDYKGNAYSEASTRVIFWAEKV